MHSQAVSYQTELLTELIREGEAELLTELIREGEAGRILSSTEAEELRRRIDEANSREEIDDLWAELNHSYGLLDESKWAT